jgi:hypothetical protein
MPVVCCVFEVVNADKPYKRLPPSRRPGPALPGVDVIAASAHLAPRQFRAAGAFDGALVHALREHRTWTVSPVLLEDTLTLTRDPVWALRALAFFAFAQSLHYAVWLKLVPEEDRARRGVRSFVASHRALVDDLGSALPLTAGALTLALCLCALCDLTFARDSYMRFAAFHGPLEIALLVLIALERRALVREGPGSAR